ncbi:MAG TPA: SAM-dependent chlorinase/fluorinase [Deltaproteobacteria bacterium]|nr:SAM-dependent chlorinase/fluorinase [Deltaproteobacteria bacterium]
MSIITLLTDFGVQDEFVGVMKGVILSINPSATVVDVTHSVDPQDIVQGAHFIFYAYPYFPRETIHVVVVDPGVGGERRIIALKKNGHIFIAPDNGILTLLVEDGEVEAAVQVDNQDYFLHPISRTFHGRDIFAPVSAHLSKGVGLKSIGRSVGVSSLSLLSLSKPYVSETGELMGQVVHVDRFGNIITNLRKSHLRALRTDKGRFDAGIHIENIPINKISDSYESVLPGEPVAVFGSRGFLEFAVNCGNASKRLNIGKGEEVRISVGKR